MEIKGVSHPIPTEYAERIYNNGKTVFVSKSHLGKVEKGDKFIIYESHGAKAYTGWADIISIQKMKTAAITRKYKNQLMITAEELKKYAKNRTEMNVIEFENFQKFKKPVTPKRFVAVSGKYLYEDEFKMIEKNKG
ncbi:DUF365 domain-containing protein [Methanobacterium aggregans]|uniref:DUF365 domain-containing protein n=1 Tax=Methanobacterium aggregans TaxID=1615586 RepID=UPI001AE72234|nr:DUF365 domain-containing protein [Methanobacterium aggregans]MBP2046741.1 hypothetical protein [Methanobacterium aggregans]